MRSGWWLKATAETSQVVMSCRGVRPLALVVAMVASILPLLSACAATLERSARPSPAPPAILGQDWGRTTQVVERPEEAFASNDPQYLVPVGSGRSGHPTHFPGQAMMADVVRTSSGYVSVGYVYPGWHPIAWTSSDGEVWGLHRLGDTDFTFPVASAVDAGGHIVAVGRSGPKPIAWTSPDGATWAEHVVPTLGTDDLPERMTAVVAGPGGFLAGGSVGPETLGRHARFWRSTDGSAWTPVRDDASAFSDAEVRSIVRVASGYVAVGLLGEAVRPTGSVAWTSPDGEHWTRVDAPDLRTGRAVSLVVTPEGGLLAVGTGLDQEEALVWTSPDGHTWTRAPGEASRRHDGTIRMNDVTVIGDLFVAVGDYATLQYATMIVWTSSDGLHWEKAHEVPVFQQSEAYAVTSGPVPGPDGSPTTGLIAVGSFGNPDNYIPTVWLSPAHEAPRRRRRRPVIRRG